MNCVFEFSEPVEGRRRATCRNDGCTAGPLLVPMTSGINVVRQCPALRLIGGPGTELAELVKSLWMVPAVTCQCRARQSQMDAWGVAGCREHREEILGWLKEAYQQMDWQSIAAACLGVFASGMLIDPRDVLGSLVDEALRRAERKA